MIVDLQPTHSPCSCTQCARRIGVDQMHVEPGVCMRCVRRWLHDESDVRVEFSRLPVLMIEEVNVEAVS